MNKVILTGRLTRDPESRMTQSNMEISRFSLACQSDFVSRDGERDTEFINCVAFPTADVQGGRGCRAYLLFYSDIPRRAFCRRA